MKDTIWSDDKIARLKELWCQTDGDYLSASGIARVLACSTNAVIGKAHRLGLPPRQSPIKRDPNAPNAPDAPRPKRLSREERNGATLPALPALANPSLPIEPSLPVDASVPIEIEKAITQAADDRPGIVEFAESVAASPGVWDVTPAALEAVYEPAPETRPATGVYVRRRPCSRVFEKVGARWITCDGIALGKSSFCPACEKQVYQRSNNARDDIAA